MRRYTEEDIQIATAELDIARENWYAACDRVRNCPDCSGGWRYKDYYDKEADKWRHGAFRCHCRGEDESKMLAIAKHNYRRVVGEEPPPSDTTKSSYY